MKKCVATLAVIFLLSTSNYGQHIDYASALVGREATFLKSNFIGPVRTILTMEHRGDKVFDTYVQTFDRMKRATEFLSHIGGADIHSGRMARNDDKDVYIYAVGGRLSKVISYEPDGSVSSTEVYAYDTKGRLSEVDIDSKAMTRPFKEVYTYKSNGLEVEVKSTVQTETLSTLFIYGFNEKGQCVERVRFVPTKTTEIFNYDAKGNVIRHTFYDERGAYSYAFVYTYKVFDAQGNWVEREKTYTQLNADGQPTEQYDKTEYRVITYYTDNRKQHMTPATLSNNGMHPTR